eukprot:c22484_g1_i1 orf=1-360(-)
MLHAFLLLIKGSLTLGNILQNNMSHQNASEQTTSVSSITFCINNDITSNDFTFSTSQGHRYKSGCLGLFLITASIFSITSVVSNGITSNAFIFSITWYSLLAPVITVLTLGFDAHQAIAN